MYGPYPYLRCQTKLNLQPFRKALRIVDLVVVNSKVGLEPLPSFIPYETDMKRVIYLLVSARPGLASPGSGKARRRSPSPLSLNINTALPLLLLYLSFISSRFPISVLLSTPSP